MFLFSFHSNFINGHQGWQLSQYGRVKNPRGHIKASYPRKSTKRNYFSIRDKEYRAARLLALVFIPNDDPIRKIFVHHIDFNRSNDALSNLRWVDASDHARIHALAGKPAPIEDSLEYQEDDNENDASFHLGCCGLACLRLCVQGLLSATWFH